MRLGNFVHVPVGDEIPFYLNHTHFDLLVLRLILFGINDFLVAVCFFQKIKNSKQFVNDCIFLLLQDCTQVCFTCVVVVFFRGHSFKPTFFFQLHFHFASLFLQVLNIHRTLNSNKACDVYYFVIIHQHSQSKISPLFSSECDALC